MKGKRYKMMKNNGIFHYKGIIIEPEIQHFFTGRIWTKQHTPFPQAKIENYIARNYFTIKPAISINDSSKRFKKVHCNRCKNENQKQFVHFHCAKCEKVCVYCRHCINMGRMSSCTELIYWNGPKTRHQRNHILDWEGQLTEAQAKAADELTESIRNQRSHLLVAVCGAGKTEILFPAILHALNSGKRVCLATPRTDVVLELFPRFQKVFPTTKIHALYGNAPKQTGYAQLIIATTHQLYRFEHAFDVVIVDEADAFPYTYDETLQKAVHKVRKIDAPIALVTATPSTKIISIVKREGWGYSFIPKRYHGFPLPVPKYETLWSYHKQIEKGKIPPKLQQWIRTRLQRKERFLLFFPTIELMEKAILLVQQLDSSILSVHAEDSDRKEKVLKLRHEEIPGLLTTTILERGITIKNVQVAVVGAESKIFTSSALIQISGRVGRNARFPDGDITFFHHGLTVEMDAARNEIQRLNREGFPK